MILALDLRMVRHWTALSLAGIVLASSIFLIRRDPAPRALAATDQEANGVPAAADPPPAVRVQHAYVTPDVVAAPEVRPEAATLKAPLRSTRKPETRRASVSDQRSTPSPRLLARATRALIGDGRHKPQPFPRAN